MIERILDPEAKKCGCLKNITIGVEKYEK